jgi:site-specific DNA-cytosine methylase
VQRILIACEFSGIVRRQFEWEGADVWSCDLEETEIPGKHYKGDVRDMLSCHWDTLVAFPPCTHLASSGARYWASKREDGRQQAAINFVRELMQANIERICIENPVGYISTAIRKPDQIIQPWQFGHGETEATCLWLKGLPPLLPTVCATGRLARIHKMGESKNRAKERSRTYEGIAQARARQWYGYEVR